jgi:hypothetical protein
MDISKMIADLQAERARLDEAIKTLEKLSLTGTPRRGRPPSSSRVASVTALRNGQNGSMNGAAVSPPQA